MAERQRSFFDKPRTRRPYPYRWRPNSFHRRNNSHILPQVQRTRPPIPACSASRAKLAAFAYDESHERAVMVHVEAAPAESDKENAGFTGGSRGHNSQEKRHLSQSQASQQLKTPSLDRQRRSPGTPGISLDDLLDESHEQEPSPPKSTPKDQVGWEHVQLPSSQFNPTTPSVQRARKRPRSESPPSSDRRATLNHAPTLPRGLPLATPLKTPRYDPGPEIWTRYTRNNLSTPSRPPASANPDMLHSSPQEPFLSSARAYRRVTSDLTHTVRKRRKLDKEHWRKLSQNSDHSNSFANSALKDKLPFLLEKLKEVTGTATPEKERVKTMGAGQTRLLPAAEAQSTKSDVYRSQEVTLPAPLTTNPGFGKAEAGSKDCHGEVPSIEDEQLTRVTHSNEREYQVLQKAHDGGSSLDRIPVPKSDHAFSDFEIGEDDLLSTCLDVEKIKSPEDDPLFKSAPSFDCPNNMTQDELQKPPAHSEMAEGRTMNTNEPTGASDFDFDEFDPDDLADMDVVLSRYDPPTQPYTNSAKTKVEGKRVVNTLKDAVGDFPDGVSIQANELRPSLPAGDKTNPINLTDGDMLDDDLDDLLLEELNFPARVQVSGNPGSQGKRKPKTIQRYLVKAVHEGHYLSQQGFKRQEKILSVQDEATGLLKAIILRDTWIESPATPGSYVHVLADFSPSGQCVVDDEKGVLVLHPDHLVSATVVADSFKCMRRAVLQDRVKATNEANQAQVYGHILHEIFQEALQANQWSDTYMAELVRTTARKYLEQLFEINMDLDQAINHLIGKTQALKIWAKTFVMRQPSTNSTVRDRNGGRVQMSVTKLLDVEEHIWSPVYGLKGNVDATVQVLMRDGEGDTALTVPLELKTGKNTSNESHRAQTALYTLLMSDRYDIEVTYGILYYLEASEMSRIPGIRRELMHMINQRNELATYVRSRLELPPMLKRERDCKRCYAQNSCYSYHKLSEDGTGESSGLGDEFVKKTQHLLPQHQAFFKTWDQLLTKEESDMVKFRRELWTMTSEERQKVGRCFSGVIIKPGSWMETSGAQKINRYKYAFSKQRQETNFSFAESQINVGDPIVISDEEGHFALANGYITQIHRTSITVAVDRRLHNARVRARDFDSKTNQSFRGLMDVEREGDVEAMDAHEQPSAVYRVDKDEFSNGMATVRNNLIRLMEKDLFGAQALRRLIIDKVKPQFAENRATTVPKTVPADLNTDQRAAITKVLSARDYALILGMPGTGKTTTIAHIIRTLTSQGKSVLLTSYTHTAVDNILLKIRDDGITTLRIGAAAKIHAGVAEFANLAAVPKDSVEELKASYDSQVVATTCLGINHPIFSQRVFDYCIVDEASQITLPVCLGPIRMARSFILVGDHYQLPPLVQNKEALEGGLDVSLFKYLSDAHPAAVVNLEHQYRMCADIMSLSNTVIYEGRLKCGNEAVASRKLSIPHLQDLAHHHYTPQSCPSDTKLCLGSCHGACWIHDALQPAMPVVFLNTDPLGEVASEQAAGSRIINQVEVTLTAQLITALLSVGIEGADMGVIALYRSQLALMRQELKVRSTAASACTASSATDVEMHTADKYQGRDKEAIILSLVRSNKSNNVGDLLKDWRRVNVALTRARTKLILVGSWSTMQNGNEHLGRLCDYIESRGWRYDLGPDACRDHLFETTGTQPSIQQIEGSKKPASKVGIAKAATTAAAARTATAKPKANSKQHSARIPDKKGTLNTNKILGRRPVLENILQEISSNSSRE